jgi:chromosome segregation ATPase
MAKKNYCDIFEKTGEEVMQDSNFEDFFGDSLNRDTHDNRINDLDGKIERLQTEISGYNGAINRRKEEVTITQLRIDQYQVEDEKIEAKVQWIQNTLKEIKTNATSPEETLKMGLENTDLAEKLEQRTNELNELRSVLAQYQSKSRRTNVV